MYKLEVRTYMRSAARKSAGSLRAFRGRLLKICIIPRGILRKVYSAIPHKNVTNLCQVPYMIAKEKLAFVKMKPICELEECHDSDLGQSIRMSLCHLG